jgi:hypothetical protein
MTLIAIVESASGLRASSPELFRETPIPVVTLRATIPCILTEAPSQERWWLMCRAAGSL